MPTNDTDCPEPELPEPWVPKTGGDSGEPPTPPICTPVGNCVDPETGEPVPLTVTITGQRDQEYVCGPGGTWELVFFVDGVEVSRTDTGVSCDDPPPADIEPIRECRNGTIHTVWYSADPTTGTVTEVSAADTGESCAPCPTPADVQCLTKRTITVGYDNGLTPGSSSNDCGLRPNFIRFSWAFTLESWIVNGSNVASGETIGPWSGWTPQLQGWADVQNSINPNPSGNSDFGFNPAPTWGFTEVTDCCPTASYGPMVFLRDDGCRFTVFPVLETETFDTCYTYWDRECDGPPVQRWLDADKNPIPEPADAECYVPCTYNFGDTSEGESDCTQLPAIYGCDDDGAGNLTPVVVIVDDCPDGRTVTAYTQDSWNTAVTNDDLVEVTLTALVDCDTGNPITIPGPCAPGQARCCVEVATNTDRLPSDMEAIHAGGWNIGSADCPLDVEVVTVDNFGPTTTGGPAGSAPSGNGVIVRPGSGGTIRYTYTFSKPVDVQFGFWSLGGNAANPIEWVELVTPWDAVTLNQGTLFGPGNLLVNNQGPSDVFTYNGVTSVEFVHHHSVRQPTWSAGHWMALTAYPICEPGPCADPVSDECTHAELAQANETLTGILDKMCEPDEPECTYQQVEGCDADLTANPPVVLATNVVKLWETCDGVRTGPTIYTYDDATGDQTPYTMAGTLVDCGSFVPIIDPPPPCDPDVDWDLVTGCICDPADSRYGDRVQWVQSVDCDGNPIYPGGALCPTVYPAKFTLLPIQAGACSGLSIASANTSAVSSTFSIGGAGGVHTIQYPLGSPTAAWIESRLTSYLGSSWDLCEVNVAGFTFVVDPSTLVQNGPGDWESSYNPPANTCSASYDAVWNSHADGKNTATGSTQVCYQWTFTSTGVIPADCGQPLNPQPDQIVEGACADINPSVDCPTSFEDDYRCRIDNGDLVVQTTGRDCNGALVSQLFYDPLDLVNPIVGMTAADVEQCPFPTDAPEIVRECLKNLDGDQFERVRVFLTPGATTPDSETWQDENGNIVGQPAGPLIPCSQSIFPERAAYCFIDNNGDVVPGWQIDVYTESGDLLVTKYTDLAGNPIAPASKTDPCDCVDLVAPNAPPDNLVVGGGKPSSWTFGGSALPKMTSVATDPNIFGPGGPVSTTFSPGGTANPLTPAYLNGLDIYFDGYVNDSAWTAQCMADLDAWVQAGGVIISTNDTPSYDAWATNVGTPNIGTSTTTWEFTAAGAGFYSSPFGTLAAGDQFQACGAYGQFDPAQVAAIPGSVVLAVDATSGNPTIYFAPYGDGCMIVMADEGPFRCGTSAGNSITTNNDLLLAGTYAWAADKLSAPATIVLPPELCACCPKATVTSTVSGCIDDGAGGKQAAWWNILSDGTTEGPFTVANLANAVECC